MNVKNTLAILGSLAALSTLAACEVTEDKCTTSADCAEGETCVIAAGETEGVCEADTAAECTGSGDECGDYTCNTASGDCNTSCTADNVADNCDDGLACIEGSGGAGTCGEPAAATFEWVAVVSKVTTDADITQTNTPGPDLDAVELKRGNQTIGWAYAAKYSPGATGTGDNANANARKEALDGQNDAIPAVTPGECSLTEDPNSKFVSVGGTGGFIVAAFKDTQGNALKIEDGDVIKVYELDNAQCSNVSRTRADVYDVYAIDDAAGLDSLTSASGFTGGFFVSLGSSDGNGGTKEFTFSAPE
jgi:hypothetical protein